MSARFVCPTCGDGRMLGVNRLEIVCVDVAAWNEDGTVKETGAIVDRERLPEMPPRHQRYICGACCCEFSEPRRVEAP